MKNDKAFTQLEKLRSQIDTINQQLWDTDREFLSREEVTTKIDQFIDLQATRLTDHASAFTSPRASLPDGIFVDHDKQVLGIPDLPEDPGGLIGTNVAPALAALFPERLREYLLHRTDELDDYGRTRNEIKLHVKELEEQRLTLENDEEKLICTIEATGTEVERRHDLANPLVVALKSKAATSKAA